MAGENVIKNDTQNLLEVNERDPGYQLMNDDKSDNDDDDPIPLSKFFNEEDEGCRPHAQAGRAFHHQS